MTATTAERALEDLQIELGRIRMERRHILAEVAEDGLAAGAFPELFSSGERQRIQEASDFLKQRRVSRTPYAILAEVGGIEPAAGFALLWLETDIDPAGIVLRERAGDGTVLDEKYPVFLAASESYLMQAQLTPPVRRIAFHLGSAQDLKQREFRLPPGSVLEHQGFQLLWRTEQQAKKAENWEAYIRAGPQQRRDMHKPVMWISRPDGRRVFVAIYDKSGNKSEFIEVTGIGERNTWLEE